MADRAAEFLASAGWAGAVPTPLAGDASGRRYWRLTRGTERAVLMDAADETHSAARFVEIATWLRSLGLSAPAVLAGDPVGGLLLLEDLGDDLFARRLATDVGSERDLYHAALDVLLILNRATPPRGMNVMDAPAMARLASLAAETYALAPPEQIRAFLFALETVFAGLWLAPDKPALRDFHAENLIWLPSRKGVQRVGILDFQDALLAHPAYDLVSLTRDARRDVPVALAREAEARFSSAAGYGTDFASEARLVAIQRNLRILGVFARLSGRYVDLIPRVWRSLEADLDACENPDLRKVVRDVLPPPTPELLDRLRAR